MVRATGQQVVDHLGEHKFAELAALIHPAKGVRFTPYTYIQAEQDVVLTAAEVRRGFANTQRYFWGRLDGRGDRLDWTFEQYFGTFVFDRDYRKAPDVLYENYPPHPRGNRLDNTKAVYPNGRTVEFAFPSSSPDRLDWRSLRIVFEPSAGSWYVVGIIHDEWTI